MSDDHKDNPADFDAAEAFLHHLVNDDDVTVEREEASTFHLEAGEPHISASVQCYVNEDMNQTRFHIMIDVGPRNAQLIVQYLRTLDCHADDPDCPGAEETELPSMKPPTPAHKAN